MSTKVELGPIPTTYVYVGQVQEATCHLKAALVAMDDRHADGATAAKHIETARQYIENVYELQADGVTS